MSHTSSTKRTVAKAFALASVAVLVPQVAAHGYVNGCDINGQWIQGFDESTWTNKASGSALLITDYLTPTYNVDGPNIVCGINPQNAQSVATVSPGDKIGWHWVTHNGANAKTWTHNEGTHRTFIAPCNGDCTQANPSSLQWTELPSQYTGQQTYDGSSWPVRTLADGNPWYDEVPQAPNGDYLIRNELTALHYSTNRQQDFDDSVQHGWGTEFYPTCMAIRIQSSSGTFDMSQAVSFPGAYTVDESGHYNPNIWTDPNSVGIAALNTYPRTQGPSGGNNSNSGSNNGNTNTGSNGNNGSSSEANANPSPSSSNSATTPTVSNPLCKRRKRSLSPAALGRRHHHRQARRLTGAH